MKCMLSMIWVPAAIGRPTPSGIFISMICPATDVAYIHVPPPNWHDWSVPSGCWRRPKASAAGAHLVGDEVVAASRRHPRLHRPDVDRRRVGHRPVVAEEGLLVGLHRDRVVGRLDLEAFGGCRCAKSSPACTRCLDRIPWSPQARLPALPELPVAASCSEPPLLPLLPELALAAPLLLLAALLAPESPPQATRVALRMNSAGQESMARWVRLGRIMTSHRGGRSRSERMKEADRSISRRRQISTRWVRAL